MVKNTARKHKEASFLGTKGSVHASDKHCMFIQEYMRQFNEYPSKLSESHSTQNSTNIMHSHNIYESLVSSYRRR